MTTDTQFLTPKEVAEILGVHQKTVHHWLRTGKLAGTKISYRAWRVPRLALEDFVAQNSNAQPPKTVPPSNDKNSVTSETVHAYDARKPIVSDISPRSKMKHYIRDIMEEEGNRHPEQD